MRKKLVVVVAIQFCWWATDVRSGMQLENGFVVCAEVYFDSISLAFYFQGFTLAKANKAKKVIKERIKKAKLDHGNNAVVDLRGYTIHSKSRQCYCCKKRLLPGEECAPLSMLLSGCAKKIEICW